MNGLKTILVADDEASIRDLIRRTLESKGFKIIEAEHGEAALIHVADQIDLLIADVVMPKVDGLLLAQLLRAVKPKMKVIFLSGNARDKNMKEGEHYLQKPFSMNTLAALVQNVLDE